MYFKSGSANHIRLEILTYTWIQAVRILLCDLQHWQLIVVYNQRGIVPTEIQHVINEMNFGVLDINQFEDLTTTHINIGT